MTYRPILFSTPMVQAILAGNKTITRRVVKPQPKLQGRADNRVQIYQRGNQWEVKDTLSSDGFSRLDSFTCPYGKVGDVLWVRESCLWVMRDHAHILLEGVRDNTQWMYKASIYEDWMKYAKDAFGYKWKPSIHMPKSACRIFLEITNIRVERLQEITRENCIAEGIAYNVENWEKLKNTGGSWYDYQRKTFAPLPSGKISPSMSFRSLWQSINGKQSWNSNPFVWVVDFKRISKPENF